MVLTNEELQVIVHQLSRIATALEDLATQHKVTGQGIDELLEVVGETEDGRKFIRIRRK